MPSVGAPTSISPNCGCWSRPAGHGEFVVQAGKRVIASLRARRIEPTIRTLRPRIAAFELHADAVSEASRRVRAVLREAGVRRSTAAACATAWIRNADFLLSEKTGGEIHARRRQPAVRSLVENTGAPEIDLRRTPSTTRRARRSVHPVPRPFARPSRTGRKMRASSVPTGGSTWPSPNVFDGTGCHGSTFTRTIRWEPAQVFDRRVDAYPTILVASKRSTRRRRELLARTNAGRTLEDLGCEIKAGPALGHTPAFVLGPDEEGRRAGASFPVDSWFRKFARGRLPGEDGVSSPCSQTTALS